MTPDEKWNQNIHITNQKRDERNLVENQHQKADVLNQDYQYLSQNLNPNSTNYYTTVATNVSK